MMGLLTPSLKPPIAYAAGPSVTHTLTNAACNQLQRVSGRTSKESVERDREHAEKGVSFSLVGELWAGKGRGDNRRACLNTTMTKITRDGTRT